MSKENVSKFFALAEQDDSIASELDDAGPETVVRVAARHGLEFDEAALRSVLKEILYAARRLPHGFGWGLVRS